MTTYRTPSWWTEIRETKELSPKAIEYFRARLKNRLHQVVLQQFLKLESRGITRADTARRIRKRPEQITRLLGAPGNWTLDTVSDLLLAMGFELVAQVKQYDEAEPSGVTSSEWLIDHSETPPKKAPALRLISSSTASTPDDGPVLRVGAGG